MAHYVVAISLTKETALAHTDLYPVPTGDEEFDLRSVLDVRSFFFSSGVFQVLAAQD